jgi:hypothetical protein
LEQEYNIFHDSGKDQFIAGVGRDELSPPAGTGGIKVP